MLQVNGSANRRRSEARRSSFLRVAEIWTPDAAGKMELRAGSYGKLAALRRASEKLRFAVGEDLPGRVLASERPVIFTGVADPARSPRAVAAAQAGLVAGLGLPICLDGKLHGVVVLLCGGGDGGGALEVWQRDGNSGQLGLLAGYYGAFHGFQRMSALMKFPIGEGLPGSVWKTRSPCIMPDLSSSSAFMRAAAASTDGFTAALGVPLFRGDELGAVVALLSRRGAPLARVFEVWVPDASGDHLVRSAACYDGADAMRDGSDQVVFRRGEGLPGRVWQERTPQVLDSLTASELVRADAARADKLGMGIGIPVVEAGYVKAVVLMLS